jgi:hypothetical protein
MPTHLGTVHLPELHTGDIPGVNERRLSRRDRAVPRPAERRFGPFAHALNRLLKNPVLDAL